MKTFGRHQHPQVIEKIIYIYVYIDTHIVGMAVDFFPLPTNQLAGFYMCN